MTVSLWHPASPDSSHTPMSVCLTSALPFSFLCWLPCHCFAAVLLGAATQHAIIYVNDTNIIGGCYCGGCPGLVLLPRYPLTSLIVSAKFFEQNLCPQGRLACGPKTNVDFSLAVSVDVRYDDEGRRTKMSLEMRVKGSYCQRSSDVLWQTVLRPATCRWKRMVTHGNKP